MPAPHITDDQRRARLASRHRLAVATRTNDVTAIVDGLVALHSSDPASVYLSAGIRQIDPSMAGIESALYDQRTVVRHHAMRRTLWVMSRAVAREAHASTTRKIAAAERKRNIALLDGDEAFFNQLETAVVDLVEGSPTPVTTRAVGAAVPELERRITLASGKPYEGSTGAHTRALLQAGFDARLVRTRPMGSWVGTQYGWTSTQAWLGESIDDPTLDQPVAAAALARRWLGTFGPATTEDLQWWAGWTKSATVAALRAIAATPVALDDGTEGWVLPDDIDDHSGSRLAPWVALLPGLDPTVMGWKRRAWYLDADVAARVTDGFGNIGPTIWADGQVVGGWVQRPDGTLATELQRPLTKAHRKLLDVEIDRIVDFVGAGRFKVRFPAPNQPDLLASQLIMTGDP